MRPSSSVNTSQPAEEFNKIVTERLTATTKAAMLRQQIKNGENLESLTEISNNYRKLLSMSSNPREKQDNQKNFVQNQIKIAELQQVMHELKELEDYIKKSGWERVTTVEKKNFDIVS